jgi:hypothetical protein
MASPEASAASSIAPSGTTFPEAVFEDLSSTLLGWKKKVCFLQTLAASMPVNNDGRVNTGPPVLQIAHLCFFIPCRMSFLAFKAVAKSLQLALPWKFCFLFFQFVFFFSRVFL